MTTINLRNIRNNPICIRQEINNGQLKSKMAMPQKDSTSDGQSTFSMDRRVYNRTVNPNPLNTKLTPAYLGMSNGTVFDGTATQKQKQWYGNRDASEIVRKNRIVEVGLGTLNARGGAMNFESKANVNTVNNALRRVRGGGAVAPAKKSHNTHNAYSPSPMNIPLVCALRIVNGYKMPYK
jgi:hypothetical protein